MPALITPPIVVKPTGGRLVAASSAPPLIFQSPTLDESASDDDDDDDDDDYGDHAFEGSHEYNDDGAISSGRDGRSRSRRGLEQVFGSTAAPTSDPTHTQAPTPGLGGGGGNSSSGGGGGAGFSALACGDTVKGSTAASSGALDWVGNPSRDGVYKHNLEEGPAQLVFSTCGFGTPLRFLLAPCLFTTGANISI